MSQKTATREEPHNMMQQDRSSHSITKEDLARHRTTREEMLSYFFLIPLVSDEKSLLI